MRCCDGYMMPRVIERFGGKHGHLGRCVIFIPDQHSQIPQDVLFNTINLGRSATQWFRDFNCTITEGHVPGDFFDYYPNGTYKGLLGKLQRSEFDTVPYFARPDSLPFNPVLIGKVFLAADVSVGFMKKFAVSSKRELTSFVTEFPGIVYVYILIALFIFIVSFLILEKKKKKLPLIKRLTLTKIAHLIEQTSYCLVDQETLDAVTTPGRIVLFTLHTLLVTFIYGLFLSKIGADLVVMKEPYNIQSIEDIIETDSQIQPMVYKQFFLINLMKQASVYRPSSTLARLYPVVMSDPENNILNADINDIGNMAALTDVIFSRIMMRKAVLVVPTDVFTWIRHFECLLNPEVMSKIQVTKETFAHGIITTLYAPKIHPMVRKVLDYFLGSLLEMGLIRNPMFRNIIAKDLMKLLPVAGVTSKVTQCQDISNGNSVSDSNSSWRPFYLHDFLHVYEIMAFFLSLATVILFLERKWSTYDKNRKAKADIKKNIRISQERKTVQEDHLRRLKQIKEKKGQEVKRLRITRASFEGTITENKKERPRSQRISIAKNKGKMSLHS